MDEAESASADGWDFLLARRPRLLHPRGAVAVADTGEPPFADAAFDLVVSRHPATVRWTEIARVPAPGGTYFAQHVVPGFTVEKHRTRLHALHDQIQREGPFMAHSTRTLIEAQKPS